MITVKLVGGLGNQMFQYAAAKSLALKLNCPLRLDINDFEKYPDRNYDLHSFPNINDAFCDKAQHKAIYSKSLTAKVKRKLSQFNIYKEPHFHFDQNFLNLKEHSYLSGYFQSENFFVAHEGEIRHLFQWSRQKLSHATSTYLDLIDKSYAVSVHFRLGDYISNAKANEVHGVCSQSYYKEAIKLILDKHPQSHFYIFSDDIPWVKNQHLFTGSGHTFIEKSADAHDSEDMFLMSKCRHNIIANSSFSWWGAWLNTNSQKTVITPTPWFQDPELNTSDLIPKNWLKL
jgi:hypothetical protein